MLKRNKAYLFDAMNLLYSMSKVVEIADLLGQNPPVPTREIVSNILCLHLLDCLLTHVFCINPGPTHLGFQIFRRLVQDSRF